MHPAAFCNLGSAVPHRFPVFIDLFPRPYVRQGDLMAVGDIPVDGEDEGIAPLVPNLHLGAVGDAVSKDGCHIVQVAYFQCQIHGFLEMT